MEIFSPVQQIQFEDNSPIWVKRDDLIDPYISGNKWRKLKYILQDAAAKGKSHLVTFGGAYSNHLVATAAAAARSKLTVTAFVRGEAITNEMLLLCSLYGMKLIFTEREAYRNKHELFLQHFGEDSTAYFIDEGGASEEAVKGCEEIISSLNASYDHICCAAGTGTTAAGLLRGINTQKLTTKLHVIPALKGGDFLTTAIGGYATDLDHLIVHPEYHFGGYAKTTPVLLNFMRKFTAATGMLIDPVYTAKMFYAIYDLMQTNYFKPDAKILAIHTGGLLGILGMKDKLMINDIKAVRK